MRNGSLALRGAALALALAAGALLASPARADGGATDGTYQTPPLEGEAPPDVPPPPPPRPPSRKRERIRLGPGSEARAADRDSSSDDDGFRTGAGGDDDEPWPGERAPSSGRDGSRRGERGDRGDDVGASRRRDVISFDVIAIPAFDLRGVQENKHWITTVRDGPKLDASLDTGAGMGGRLGFGRDWEYLGGSLGALYLWSHFHDDATDRSCDLHVFMAEFEAHIRVPRDADLRLRLGGAGGLGGFVYDFPQHDFHDTGGLSFGARCFAGVSLWDHAQLDCSLGYLWLGYPTELLGTGAYFTVSLGVSF